MTEGRAIMLDLSKHLDQKIKLAIEDFVELCERTTDIDEHDMLIQVVTLCSHYAALAGLQLDAGENEYLKVCMFQYRKGRQCLTQRMASSQ